MEMTRRFLVIAVIFATIALISTSCVRRPSTRSERTHSERVESPRRHSGRSSSNRDSGSLASRVQRLTNTIDRKSSSNSFTEKDVEEWMEKSQEYALEYIASISHLSDKECESIEYNFGKIAGILYNDQVVPLLDELEEIADGLDEYESRSEKWEGALERGFESASGRRR